MLPIMTQWTKTDTMTMENTNFWLTGMLFIKINTSNIVFSQLSRYIKLQVTIAAMLR